MPRTLFLNKKNPAIFVQKCKCLLREAGRQPITVRGSTGRNLITRAPRMPQMMMVMMLMKVVRACKILIGEEVMCQRRGHKIGATKNIWTTIKLQISGSATLVKALAVTVTLPSHARTFTDGFSDCSSCWFSSCYIGERDCLRKPPSQPYSYRLQNFDSVTLRH